MDKPILPGLLALTMGDPAGIGIEITLAAWRDRRAHALPPFVFYGDADVVAARAGVVGVPLSIHRLVDGDMVGPSDWPEIGQLCRDHLVLCHIPCAVASVPGTPDARNGLATIKAINCAVESTMQGDFAAVVTNPIAKHVLYDAGFRHPGHTEYLAALADGFFSRRTRPHVPVMMLAADDPILRVVPMTVHEPLAKVPGMITAALIVETTRITHRALIEQFGIARPRIAIAGLNPHAGEHGSIGAEDRDIIAPAIAAMRAEGLAVTGPHSADTLFHAPARATYDAVICMYHDQALIPIKTLAFDTGVNLTLGLPFVRTSPDHGTAFDIAGRGTASPASLIAALKMAARLGARVQKV
jgi:4-hydroxythreonine-4-phosphate dehydrogenase